jgi:amino acid transporter
MKLRVLLSLATAAIALVVVWWYFEDPSRVPGLFGRNLRGSLFAGLLTVSSFLLSLKTFIIVKLKENVYDSEAYRRRLACRKGLNGSLTLYGPLKRLSTLLFFTICSALFAAVSQLTVGLIPHWVASFVCIFLSVFALCMVVCTLMVIRRILQDWLDSSEDQPK